MTKAQRYRVARELLSLMLAECVERDLIPVCLVYAQEDKEGNAFIGTLESAFVHAVPGALRQALADALATVEDPDVESVPVNRALPGDN